MVRINIIAAVADNGVVGLNNDLPWREEKLVPKDFPHFKEQTLTHCIVSGKNTLLGMGVLPKRRNVVVSTTLEERGGLIKYSNLIECLASEKAICREQGIGEIFLLGGPGIWKEALISGIVDRAIITRIHEIFDGDTFFPEEELREHLDLFYVTSTTWKEEAPKLSSTLEVWKGK